jgi:chromosomal replication initiation ATPase DnaA
MTKTSAVIDALRVRDLLELVDHVCKRRGVTRHELCGRGRTQNISMARQEAWWRIRYHPERHYSYPEIAQLFARNHTTIMAGVYAHERRCPPAPPLDNP